MTQRAELVGADVPGWTRWQTYLMECNRCSALVPCMPDSRLNHERWHALNDGAACGNAAAAQAEEDTRAAASAEPKLDAENTIVTDWHDDAEEALD